MYAYLQQDLRFWNSSPEPGNPADSGNRPDQVSSTTVLDLPSTRARGQDDVSSQANSLKLRQVTLGLSLRRVKHIENTNLLHGNLQKISLNY